MPFPISTWNQVYLQDSSSILMGKISSVHDGIMMLVIFIVSMILYIFMCGIMTSLVDLTYFSNESLEIGWVSAPMFALASLAIPSLHCLYLAEEASNPLLTLKAIGHQWYWSYEYDGFTSMNFDSYMLPTLQSISDFRLLETDNQVIVPVDTEIRMLITSQDVIHSFSLPSFGLKMDAIPGRINQMFLNPKKLGSFYGQCSEMCGAMHSFMPITVNVVPVKDFLNWVNTF